MWFPYAFTNPDEAGLRRRRQLLDTYGQVAQLSALILLFAFRLPFLVRWLKRRFRLAPIWGKAKEHSSPVVERFGAPSVGKEDARTSIWSRIAWQLDQEVWPGWGTWRVLLVAALWTAWLFVLAISDTGDGMSMPVSFLDTVSTSMVIAYSVCSLLPSTNGYRNTGKPGEQGK